MAKALTRWSAAALLAEYGELGLKGRVLSEFAVIFPESTVNFVS